MKKTINPAIRRAHTILCGEKPLWLVERTDDTGYDEYDSCIAAANDEPNAIAYASATLMGFDGTNAKARIIGYTETEPAGVVFASFNAG